MKLEFLRLRLFDLASQKTKGHKQKFKIYHQKNYVMLSISFHSSLDSTGFEGHQVTSKLTIKYFN